jgi:SAM-dependent methyltransferase
MRVPRYEHPVFALQYHLDEGDASHLDDLDWYLARLAPGPTGPGHLLPFGGGSLTTPSPVIELGAGTGRVTRALVEAGVAVIPLDMGAPMLRILTGRDALRGRVAPVCADMSRLPFRDRSVRTVLSAYNSLGCLLERRLLDETLADVHRVLVPGGRLVFDVAANRPEDRPSGRLDLGWREWSAPDGLHIRRRTRLDPHPEEERIDLRYDYRWRRGTEPESRQEVVFSMNTWPPETYLDALIAAGFDTPTLEERTFETPRGQERHWAFVETTKLV